MHLDVILDKTERAQMALLRRDTLSRQQRQFLLMVDGHKSLRDLVPAAQEIGIDNVTLAALANQGLIQWKPCAEMTASP